MGGRLLLGFAARNVFPGAVGSFMVSQHISGGDAIRAAFIFMILAEVLVRTATLAIRATLVRRSPRSVAVGAHPAGLVPHSARAQD
ncbi:MAG: hypothetical protein ACRENL_04925 [Candidatus Dormibacteria bacterium]